MELNSITVLKKLERRAKAEKSRLLDLSAEYSRKRDDWAKQRAEAYKIQASRVIPRTVSGLTYKIRSNYFSTSNGNCEFYPDRIYAHSYRWYDLVKVIKGQVILNDYRYSQQTSQHISKVSQVMRDLGIKYKTLEAPRGLQNLEAALAHELDKQAGLIVREKYARIKSKSWVKRMIRESESNVKLLAELGVKATKAMRIKALADNESYRRSKLERQKEERQLKKAMDSLQIIPDFDGVYFDAQGYHVIHARAWSWNEETKEYTGKLADYERRHAVSKGFKTVIVHRNEPAVQRHLKVVE